MRRGFTGKPHRSGTAVSAPESDALQALQPGHQVDHPAVWTAPVIFASPHSGSIYPTAFVERSLLNLTQLRRNEDMFVDRLVGAAVAAGAPLLSARFPRCYVDVNRASDDLPQRWSDAPLEVSVRAQAGIGVVPTHIGERTPIYRRDPSRADVDARIRSLYHPYHAALQNLIDQSVARFGRALLLDCHSMPGFAPMGSRRPDIVLGDRFGRACHPETLFQVRQILQDADFSVAVNYPYAGGYVTRHYGQPETGVETIQIEINRDLYLNPVTLAPKRSYDDVADRLRGVVHAIIRSARPEAMAAQ